MPAERPQPWLIVHRAAESRRRLAAALRSGADFIEVDLRLGGRVECRHDALVVPWLPFLTQRHRFPRLRRRRLWLEEIRPPARLFLDFKEDDPALVEQAVETLRRSGLLSTAAASTPHWRLLDRLATIAPEVERFYSVGRKQRQRWKAYGERMARGEAGAGVSLHHSLATPERLRRVAAAGLRALVYPVNDASLGWRLVAEGAGGLISDRPALMAVWRERWGGREE